jgi:hypothetical protein
MILTALQTQNILTEEIAQSHFTEEIAQSHFTTINSRDISEAAFPKVSIQIPSQLADYFAGNGSGGVVRAVSYVYRNISPLFPSGRPAQSK